MVVVGLVGPAYYPFARRRLGEADAPPTRTDRLARNVVVASLPTLVLLALGPPDPFAQAYTAAVALPVLVAVVYTHRDVLPAAVR